MYVEHDFLDRFAAAAADGFDAVEFLFPYDFEPAEIASRLADNGLQQVLFNAPPGDFAGGERGITCLAERRDEFPRGIVEKALPYALALRCPRLHVMAGLMPAGIARAALHEVYLDNLAWAAGQAASAGLDLLIEPINNRDVPGYLMNNFDMAAQLIGEMQRPNLKLQFDIYHRQIIHGDVTRGLETLMPITGHIQISSAPLRHEPMSGELDDLRILETIERLNYAGHIGCEYNPAAGTLAGLGWMKRIG